VSFFVIGVVWINHPTMVNLVARVDRRLLFYNLLLLFFVTTIPFTTSTLAEYLYPSHGRARTSPCFSTASARRAWRCRPPSCSGT
jgi:uncharacterized membrane protein